MESKEKEENEESVSSSSIEKFERAKEEAEQELADLKYSKKTKSLYKFVQPPRTQKELLRTISEVDARYEASKAFLQGNQIEQEKEVSEERMLTDKDIRDRLPPNFMISTLAYPGTGSEIILWGVDNRSYIHAYTLSEILLKLAPNLIFTQIPADAPYFVRKPANFADWESKIKNSYYKEFYDPSITGYLAFWSMFMKNIDKGQFYINPGPHYLTDIMLLKNKTEKIIEENLMPWTKRFDIGSNIAYSLASESLTDDLMPDWFFTALVHHYNNLDGNVQLVIGGYPVLALRDQIVRNYSMDELKDHFDTMIDQFEKNNLNFDPQYLMADHCIDPQAEYMAEVLRQSWYSAEKIVAVVDKEMVPFIQKHWRNLPNTRKLIDLYKSIPTFNEGKRHKTNSYVEYIQKHALVDVMFNSFIADHFMNYKFFPFNGVGLPGWEVSQMNTEQFWSHFYGKFMSMLNNVFIDEKSGEDFKHRMKYQENISDDEMFPSTIMHKTTI
jgi:hypothetical protein